MGLVLEMINPMYLVICGGVFMIICGCACYGCHDILYSQSVNAAGSTIACDASDCEIQDVHEQHIIEDKGDSLWSKKAWGMEQESYNDGDATIMMIPHSGFENLGGTADFAGGDGGDGGGGAGGGGGE